MNPNFYINNGFLSSSSDIINRLDLKSITIKAVISFNYFYIDQVI